jgi:hypothetical protein
MSSLSKVVEVEVHIFIELMFPSLKRLEEVEMRVKLLYNHNKG